MVFLGPMVFRAAWIFSQYHSFSFLPSMYLVSRSNVMSIFFCGFVTRSCSEKNKKYGVKGGIGEDFPTFQSPEHEYPLFLIGKHSIVAIVYPNASGVYNFSLLPHTHTCK